MSNTAEALNADAIDDVPSVVGARIRRIALVVALVILGVAATTGPVALLLGPSNETDGFQLLLGKNQDELSNQGKTEYPNEGAGHNHACHRLAARLTTERYGLAVALAAGLANELAESTALALMGHNPLSRENIDETTGDLSANWRGAKDGVIRVLGRRADR